MIPHSIRTPELTLLKPSSVTAVILVVLLIMPIVADESTVFIERQQSFTKADEVLLPAQDYVWQEINGFCAWAATTMAMQYAGVDLTLYDVLSWK